MRATSIGHAGILVESDHGSILCDPWFVPAFLGAWFPFPRNDQLDDDLLARIEAADHLYVSHLHGDHWDEPWLRDHLPRDIDVLLPGYPTRELERKMRGLGFTNLTRTVDGEELDLGGLTVAIHVETSITDGPGGDSALVVSDGEVRIVDQNDCRTTDLDALRAHGPVDLHWLQYSGAIWYPMVYDLPAGELRPLVRAKIESQLARAMRYVESVAARAVVPSAGPPCFLDPDLYHLNVIHGDEPSIFVDQRVFLDRLADSGHHGILAVPGTTIEVTPDKVAVHHPAADDEVGRIFTDKADHLRRYQRDWIGWIDDLKAGWLGHDDVDLVADLQQWWHPLLAMAPTLRAAVGAACLLRADDVEVLVDFPAGEVQGVRRRAVSLPLRRRPGAGRVRGRRASGRLEQLAVPVVPVPGVARGRVQRVGLQLLQVAVGRADAPDGGRGGAPARPADRDRAGHRARRVDRPAPVPASQRRPVGVRRGRRTAR